MKLLKLAEAYLRQAAPRLRDAQRAFHERNYPYAVRLSQECVELCLKAALRIVAIDYPKVHDVSTVLLAAKSRFPPWFQAEIEFLADSSALLAKKRELCFYGVEEELLTPEEAIDKVDAEDAISRASRVFELCQRLLREAQRASEQER